MKELANKRIIEYDSTPSKQEPTGAQFLKVLLDEPEKTPSKKQIVLYLKEGLSGAEKNFTKYPNDIFQVMHDYLKRESESLLYIYLWRESWGYGRNYCRIGYAKIVKGTVIGCEKTVKRAISGLVEQHFIIKAINNNGDTDVNTDGSLYRIITPKEIHNKAVEEGILLDDIPIEGAVMIKDGMDKFTMDKMSTTNKTSNDNVLSGVVKMSTGKNVQRTKSPDGQFVHSEGDKLSMDNLSIPDVNTNEIMEEADGGQNAYGQNVHPLKDILKDNIKDTLSQDQIIDLFYNSIGQTKITKQKRERAENNIKELLEEGFSEKDIAFAVKWTIDNSREKPYDFSLIKDTVGQAMAEKGKVEKKEIENLERKKMLAQKQVEEKKQEKLLESVKEYKNNLDNNQRKQLREESLNAIRNTKGIREEFITEILIEAKENEIIAAKLGINSLET